MTRLVLTALLAITPFAARAGVILNDNFSYPDGPLTNVSGGKWVFHSPGANPGMPVVSGVLQVSQNFTDDNSAVLTNAPYHATNSVDIKVAALYSKFTINLNTLPGSGATYFAHFKDAGSGNAFRARIWALTNGASPGTYRVGIANSATPTTNIISDLSPGVTYTLVCRYVLGTGVSTLWLDPANETSFGVTAADAVNTGSAMATYAFRQASTDQGIIGVDDLVVGTSFADVVPGSSGSNPPFIGVNPQGTNVVIGTTVNLKSIAGGDPTLNYQWQLNQTNLTVASATSNILTIASATTNNSGPYRVIVSNTSGSVTSTLAQLVVSEPTLPPVITNQPQSLTVTIGETATFSVGASGSPVLHYQWKFFGTNLVGQNGTTLQIAGATPANAGPYSVTVTNNVESTNSDTVTLTVNQPEVVNISLLRSTVDPVNYIPTNTTAFYTVEGVVISHANTTPSPNLSFYMQDSTAGINVFMAGNSSNVAANLLPSAGDWVRVTGPLTHFRGLLEFGLNITNPLHSIVIVSNGAPLPAPVNVPFDPTTQANPVIMDALEGSYVVASNVFLQLGSATYPSGQTLLITNSIGQTFTLFVNASTDIPGKNKSTGPVTIFGAMGQFDNSAPHTSGYQLIPTRFADIIGPIRYVCVLENLVRPNGQPTNSLPDQCLRPGEKITIYVTSSDPAGGSITIEPVGVLPSGATWASGSQSGTTVSNTFTFQANGSHAGNNYNIALRATTAQFNLTNIWSIYVPSATEQEVFISEYLANPTTDTNSPFFNPLHRFESTNASVYDEYIEIVNLSGNNVELFNWSISDSATMRHLFDGGDLTGGSAYIVYGGPFNGFSPNVPVPAVPASESATSGLALNNDGDSITLRNNNSYVIDRIFYGANGVSGRGSMSRFPTTTNKFVPQNFISTNLSTAGLQYDGGAWGTATKVPSAVTNVVVTAGNPLVLTFITKTNQATTLWQANELTNKFEVVNGGWLTNTPAAFQITNPPASHQYYFITTQ